MNEIKFRIWNKKTKKMIKDVCIHPEYGFLVMSDNDALNETIGRVNPNDIIWQQYTGLKDKNGTDIYEGDIIKFIYFSYKGKSEDSYIVQFSRHMAMGWWLHNTKESPEHGSKDMCWNCSKQYEVIGNIYKNPNLIK